MEGTWREVEAHSPLGAVLAEANRLGWNGWIIITADALLAGARRDQLDVLFGWALEGYPQHDAEYLKELWEAARNK